MALKKASRSGVGRGAKSVETVRHRDKRKNIPTEELRDFVREDEQQPRKVLYPRDPDLDPQLVWKGKDEQDAEPLEVPAVPVYIQEKIHPQAIIEDFKATAAKAEKAEAQLDLFSDFNGLPEDFADRVDFYHHEGNWSNRLILGRGRRLNAAWAWSEGPGRSAWSSGRARFRRGGRGRSRAWRGFRTSAAWPGRSRRRKRSARGSKRA